MTVAATELLARLTDIRATDPAAVQKALAKRRRRPLLKSPSTSGGASFARSPSGEGSSIRSPASGDSTIPSRIREEQDGVAETTARTPPACLMRRDAVIPIASTRCPHRCRKGLRLPLRSYTVCPCTRKGQAL